MDWRNCLKSSGAERPMNSTPPHAMSPSQMKPSMRPPTILRTQRPTIKGAFKIMRIRILPTERKKSKREGFGYSRHFFSWAFEFRAYLNTFDPCVQVAHEENSRATLTSLLDSSFVSMKYHPLQELAKLGAGLIAADFFW